MECGDLSPLWSAHSKTQADLAIGGHYPDRPGTLFNDPTQIGSLSITLKA